MNHSIFHSEMILAMNHMMSIVPLSAPLFHKLHAANIAIIITRNTNCVLSASYLNRTSILNPLQNYLPNNCRQFTINELKRIASPTPSHNTCINSINNFVKAYLIKVSLFLQSLLLSLNEAP